MKHTTFSISEFYCTQCGKKTIPIARICTHQRAAGHLKNLYCPWCRKENNCVEIRPGIGSYTYETFKLEFTLGRYRADGTKERTCDLPKCSRECKYCQDGVCWNTNCSYECNKRR